MAFNTVSEELESNLDLDFEEYTITAVEEFLKLQKDATLVITDSGGIQEETTYLGIPCLTIRENTERPVTVSTGTNILVGQDMELLKAEVSYILDGRARKGSVPALWDGKAGERIADVIEKWYR